MTLRFAALCIAIVFALNASQSPTKTHAKPVLHWLLLRKAMQAMQSDPVATRFFGTPETYLIGPPKAEIPAGWRSTRTVVYSSYAAIEKAFADGSAPQQGAILYDNEKWEFTPDEEKADPARFEQMAAKLVHSHGLTFISTPAMNLTGVLKPGRGQMSDKYLALGIARDAGRYADVIDIQAQSLQFDATRYAQVVSEAARQAREVNPKVIVLAGLTTRNRKDGTPATADDLLRAVDATRGVVDGYWLNVPVKSEYCPNCAEFRPDLALDFLHQLDAKM